MGKLPKASAGCRASEVLTCARAKFVTGCSTFRCTAFLFSLICAPQVLAGWRFSIFGLTSGVPDGVTGANCREECNMIPFCLGRLWGLPAFVGAGCSHLPQGRGAWLFFLLVGVAADLMFAKAGPFGYYCPRSASVMRMGGRAVECTGLENRRGAILPEFESQSIRQSSSSLL